MRDFYPFIQPFLTTYWRAALLGFLLNIVTNLSGLTLLALSGWFISTTALAGLTFLAIGTTLPSAGIRAAALIRIVSRYFDLLISHHVILQFLCDLRVWVFKKCIPLAPFHLALFHSSDLLSRMIADINMLDGFYLRVLLPFATSVLIAALSLCFLYPSSTLLAWLFLGAYLLIFIVLPYFFSRWNYRVGERLGQASVTLRMKFIEGVQSLGTLLSFNLLSSHQADLTKNTQKLYQAQTELNILESLALTGFHCITGFILVITLYQSPSLLNQDWSLPHIAFLCFSILGLTGLFAELPLSLQSMGKIKFSAARIHALEHSSNSIIFPTHSLQTPLHLDLRFQNVSFRYPGSHFPVLSHFTETIRFGEHVLIEGPTGAGKSSLAFLAVRFLEPKEGEIFLGDIPLKNFSERDLRQSISMVSQFPYLFAKSIRHNLLFGKPEASSDELWSVLKQVGLEHDIHELPEGLDTPIGEAGSQLSGGQQKRLAIASALLYAPSILILDEPTEGLDQATHSQMMKNIQTLYQDKTLCVISHHTEDLENFKKIIKLS